MGRKQVLLLDDQAKYGIDLAGAVKSTAGEVLSVHAVDTVEEVRKRIAKGDVDLCLIDITSAENQSGSGASKLFRGQYPKVKIVLISMHKDLDLDKYDFVDDIMFKSADLSDLICTLQYLLSGQEAARRALVSEWPALGRFFRKKQPVGLVNREMIKDRFGQAEKISVISGSDKAYVCVNCYRLFSHRSDQVFLTLSASSGCSQKCVLCASYSRSLVRPFGVDELMGQLYWLLGSQMIAEYVQKHRKLPHLTVNFSGEGDVLADNALNGSLFLAAADKLFGDRVQFIVTSVGNAAGLAVMKEKCLELPLSHYWSVHSFDQVARDKLQKGAAVTGLVEMRARYEDVYQAQCRAQNRKMPKITIAVTLIDGENNKESDFDLMADFVRGRPFEIKVMPYSADEERRYEFIKTKLEDFKIGLAKRDTECRIRYNTGLMIKAGCGTMVFRRAFAQAPAKREKIRKT